MQVPLQLNTAALAHAEEGSLPTPTAAKPVARKSSGGGNKKGTSAERRATHNAVERARRESLNYRFLELAANLPATCTVRRASKNLIVNKSLEFVRNALHSDAVLRLRLDEVMRQNQSLLEEVNQLRAERGLSPRTNPASVQAMQNQPRQSLHSSSSSAGVHDNSTNPMPVFSTDALTAAFGMPGLPQPLATVEFTKQVTEQGITMDYSNPNAWFSNEQDDDGLSNNASTDDFSAAASDHSSPSLGGDSVQALAASAGVASSFPTNSMFRGVQMPTTSTTTTTTSQQHHHTPTPPYNVFAQPQMAASYSSSAGSSAYNEGSPTSYAHYAGQSSHNVVATPMIQFTTPYTPTSAAMLQHMLSLGSTNAGLPPSLSPSSSSAMNSTSSPGINASNSSSAYAHGGIYAMPA